MATGLNRNINDAHPRLQEVWYHAQREWQKRYPEGWPRLLLNETHRPITIQRAYYAQGRQKLSEVNTLRRAAGLAAIGEQEARKKVTQLKPGQSKHGLKPSAAIDILILNKAGIENNVKYYKELADIIQDKDPKVRWGGDWDMDGRSDDERFTDLPHFEI